jgi:hypothetical protein
VPALRGLFKAVASGMSLRRVASVMVERVGGYWDAGKVRNIVRDPRYKLGETPVIDPRIWNRANAELDRKRPNRAKTCRTA